MPDFGYFLSQLFNGIKLGSVYAMVAIGYSMVYGILRLINFAHGDIMTVGVYTILVLFTTYGMPLWLTIIISVALSIIVGLTAERVAYRPLRSSGEETTLISSLAVSILIQNIIVMVFSPQRVAFHLPDYLSKLHTFGTVRLSTMNIITFVAVFVILIALSYMIKNTRVGMAMRACSDNMNAARLMGINVTTIIVIAFAIGSALAALSGLMLAGEYKTIDPLMGFVPGLKAFCAAVLGGIGSLGGAVLGGFILGIIEMLFAGLMPTEITPYRDAFVFLVLILVLLIKPNGILGSNEGGRS
ncbi:branched-chain amino acid ABC transporter permease [Gudongella oleilytica]|jgi:branched-chain amino acid transport system permease protein|uniref:branched-chain amino acid ABC transporter permease n=1 Tax=Gudongella oleilytica TaxID=1582259 RepID=UPI000FF8A440|nr:branched-chain amino acid ABC transporter permease [Gudongella oleilytica]MDY0257278.1 branched-chain amino acid ABC transporter permease [Gudongella oleilytica]